MGSARARRDEYEVEHRADPATGKVPEPSPGPLVHVGAMDDPAEARAERLAAHATELAGSLGAATGPTAVIRRSPAPAGGSTALRGGFDIPAAALAGASTGGTALDAPVRSTMEAGLGRDLGDVRVHTGAAAGKLARSLGASAFASGNDVYFGAGEYAPDTAAGSHLLAHELAHTVDGGGSSDVHRYPATALTAAPVDWAGETANVIRPGGGMSGGVYILKAKDQRSPVPSAVVKPVFGKNALGLRESAAQLQAGDKMLSETFGLSAPASRTVNKGDGEYGALLALCASKQPPKPDYKGDGNFEMEQAAQNWKPMTDAEAFIVMGEVVNADSIAGMATDAVSDPSKIRALWDTVFDSTFLFDLGKLCVGDLLLGNEDRIVLNAGNIGNVLVSKSKGQAGKIQAIDTSANLPKPKDPNVIINSGRTGGSFNKSFVKLSENGAGDTLDRFYAAIVTVMKEADEKRQKGGQAAAKASPAGLLPWEVISSTYATGRSRFLADFEWGWDAGLEAVQTLLADPATIKKFATDMGDDPNVTADGLQANASYLSELRGGADHKEASAGGLGIAIKNYLQGLDFSQLVPPADMYYPGKLRTPDKKALRAEWEGDEAIAAPAAFDGMGSEFGRITNQGKFNQIKTHLDGAHGRAANSVQQTKKKGVFNRKTVDTNRAQLVRFLIDSEAMIIGAFRTSDALNTIEQHSKQLAGAASAKFGPEGGSVATSIDLLGSTAPVLATLNDRYKSALEQAKAGLAQVTETVHAAAISGQIDHTLKAVDRTVKRGTDLKQLDLKKVAAGIRSAKKK